MYRNAVRHLSEDKTKDFQRKKNRQSGNRLIVSALHKTPVNRVFAANISFVQKNSVVFSIDCWMFFEFDGLLIACAICKQ